jgi:uncharacterized protein HemY
MLAKILIFTGLSITFIGIMVWFGIKIGIPFGKMPGDIHIQKERYMVYFPIVTGIIISVFLTVFLNLILWFFRK